VAKWLTDHYDQISPLTEIVKIEAEELWHNEISLEQRSFSYFHSLLWKIIVGSGGDSGKMRRHSNKYLQNWASKSIKNAWISDLAYQIITFYVHFSSLVLHNSEILK
jgi:hypothetical protein